MTRFPYDTDMSSDEASRPGEELGVPFWKPQREADDRLLRVTRAWGFAEASVQGLSRRYQAVWEGAILDLTDDKGTLVVQWRDHESRVMFEGIIVGAWERSTVEHLTRHVLHDIVT